MVNSERYSTDLRLLLSEVIWLEPEHFEQATEISSQINGEAEQWQTYLNTLAVCALEEWLREKIPDHQPISRDTHVIEPICHLKMGNFTYVTITTQNLHDEVVNIPQAVLERPELAAHFYVLLEVPEEQEEVIMRGFLRHDQLDSYRSTVNLQPQNDYYQLPLSLFDPEPNHLLFYSRYLKASTIPLPVASAESPQDSLLSVLQSTRTKLSEWLEGNFDLGWLSVDTLLSPEANLAWSTRNTSEGAKGGKLINLGMQLGNQTVALLVTVTPETSEKVGILVQLYPTEGERCLPPDLQLTLLSRLGKILQSTRSRSQDNYIQLKPFQGKRGNRFSVEVTIGDVSVREDFEL
jgi:hypothetical protein